MSDAKQSSDATLADGETSLEDLPHPWREIYGGSIKDRNYDPLAESEELAIREEFDRLVYHQSSHRNIVHPEHPDHPEYPLCGRIEPFGDSEMNLRTKDFAIWPPGWFADESGDRLCTYCLEVWRKRVF